MGDSGILAPYLVVAVVCACIAATVAGNKGRSAGGWFLLGLLLPVIAVIAAAVIQPMTQPTRPCPHCSAQIPATASACAHCAGEVEPSVRPGVETMTAQCPACKTPNLLELGTTEWTCTACRRPWHLPAKV